MSDLLNILQSKEVPIENQQILDYLQGQLKAGAQHNLEEHEQDDPMMKDAMEGLQMMPDNNRLPKITSALNVQLQQRINAQKQKRKETARWKDQNWILLTTVTILILMMICFIILWRYRLNS